MTNQVKAAIWVVGSAIAIYLAWTYIFSPKSISKEEKEELFMIASGGLRGGVPPPPEIEEQWTQQEQQALLKIEELGLLKEYEKFKETALTYPRP